MRYLLVLGLSAALWSFAGCSVSAEELVEGEQAVQRQVVSMELVEAYREYQLAKLRMHEYRFVTLPQQRRQLDDHIKLAKTEIAFLHRRLRDYRPLLQVGRYSPVRTAAEGHRLARDAAEQRLRQLEDERIGLLRLTRQQNQVYQLDVLRAAARLALVRKSVE